MRLILFLTSLFALVLTGNICKAAEFSEVAEVESLPSDRTKFYRDVDSLMKSPFIDLNRKKDFIVRLIDKQLEKVEAIEASLASSEKVETRNGFIYVGPGVVDVIGILAGAGVVFSVYDLFTQTYKSFKARENFISAVSEPVKSFLGFNLITLGTYGLARYLATPKKYIVKLTELEKYKLEQALIGHREQLQYLRSSLTEL